MCASDNVEESMDVRGVAAEFLSHRRFAVAGVSRDPRQAANLIYRRLRSAGYQVFAVNPGAQEVEGEACFASLRGIAGVVDVVVVVTRPEVSAGVVRECAELGIRRVWLHRSLGTGSVSSEAVELCAREGITVLDGACPMMFLEPVDFGHRCMRWVLGATGGLPRPRQEEPSRGRLAHAEPIGPEIDRRGSEME